MTDSKFLSFIHNASISDRSTSGSENAIGLANRCGTCLCGTTTRGCSGAENNAIELAVNDAMTNPARTRR
jgi:hypothetical protein